MLNWEHPLLALPVALAILIGNVISHIFFCWIKYNYILFKWINNNKTENKERNNSSDHDIKSKDNVESHSVNITESNANTTINSASDVTDGVNIDLENAISSNTQSNGGANNKEEYQGIYIYFLS